MSTQDCIKSLGLIGYKRISKITLKNNEYRIFQKNESIILTKEDSLKNYSIIKKTYIAYPTDILDDISESLSDSNNPLSFDGTIQSLKTIGIKLFEDNQLTIFESLLWLAINSNNTSDFKFIKEFVTKIYKKLEDNSFSDSLILISDGGLGIEDIGVDLNLEISYDLTDKVFEFRLNYD